VLDLHLLLPLRLLKLVAHAPIEPRRGAEGAELVRTASAG
jgi:hypothetical protein